ncbi:hypothetical protein PR202_gb22141 [Eleusine coracana subsp. coracana]|uniref:Nucleotide-diphospho-sugar transferase domain-containing protein n=1 Tax=Eleusine coracana subsp. coracana TaxID=191504 RepID=A0AAV5FEZ9_ELECO|nr:hypothetical protein PR202_gb22141 [Eleusine coracana subsp. coracana]
MSTVRNLLRFLVISSVACVVLLLVQRAADPCPCRGAVPARKEQALAANGTHPSKKKLGVADEDDDNKLPEILSRAAMEDKTILMTFTNEAWSAPGSLMDLFLESFRIGVRTEPLLKHLVIVTADAKAFARCEQVHALCYAFPGGGANFAKEQRFVFTDDVDIVWFRNPLLRIPVAVDFAMSADSFYGDNPYDLDKRANGGFVYAKASPRTVAFYEGWYEARKRFPGKNEQDLIQKLERELAVAHGVTAQFVDTAYLGGFCERRKKVMDFNKLCTFHANCLVGLKMKLDRLRGVLDAWKKFKATNGTVLTD